MRLFKACTLIFALVFGSYFIFQSLLGTNSKSEPIVCLHDHSFGNDFQNKDQLLDIIEEDQPNGDVIIYAKNSGFCPLTVDIQFPELINMETDVELPFTAVVPTRSEKYKLLTIAPAKSFKGGNLSYRYSFNYNVGDIINAKHNDDYEYLLPFSSNKSYIVGQGYGLSLIHI